MRRRNDWKTRLIHKRLDKDYERQLTPMGRLSLELKRIGAENRRKSYAEDGILLN